MFINNTQYNWLENSKGNSKLAYKGDREFALNILNASNIPDKINELFKKLNRFSSGVVETDKLIIAWVDHIRSWPLFYSHRNEQFLISQSAYEIKDSFLNSQFKENNLIEFKLSGYVTGKETLIDGVLCLNPGEYLIWDKNKKALIVEKYFSYIPSFDSLITHEDAISQQNTIFDNLTKTIIQNAEEKTIWVPLSGGLDSRILLCKLHEHGYKNIRTFTYGPRFNFEGLVAKKIAKKLNIPWQFVHVPKKVQKQYFQDQNRKDFFKFAGNLKTIPCMREYAAIRYLHESNQINKGAIFLNGQSGDYISGGHISKASRDDYNYNLDTYYKIIINKHYDLWKQFKTPKNLEIIKEKINSLVNDITDEDLKIDTPLKGAQLEEVWEYEARQICYVVNGQRAYEYFGYNWEMPLWEREVVDFYRTLPYEMKYEQKIFKDYLHTYNYQGLFPAKDRYIWRWPLPMLWVIPIAQIIGLFAGRKRKDNFYAKMRYWGHYANQYAFFDVKIHHKTIQKARNVVALYVDQYLKENDLSL